MTTTHSNRTMPPPVLSVGASAGCGPTSFPNWFNSLLTLFAVHLIGSPFRRSSSGR